MRLRGVVVLATIAALLGAPPSASAAVNILHSPSASPTSGTTDTLFELGVVYDGRFAASSVSATAGEDTVEMALVAGSATSGTWRASLRLPPGTWPVTFAADAERGGDPVLSGPILLVAAATPPPAISVPAAAPDLSSPTAADEPEGSARESTDAGNEPVAASAATAPASAPTAAPAPNGSTSGGEDAADAPAPAPAPSAAEATAAGTPASGGTDGAVEPGGDAAPRDSPSPAPSAEAATADQSVFGSGGSEAARVEPDAEEGDDSGVLVEDELVTMSARATAIWGSLLLVAIATGLGLVVRRRRRAVPEAEVLSASSEAEVVLQRRAVRRGRLRVADEDPIVASMHLDERGGRRPPSRHRAIRREDDVG